MKVVCISNESWQLLPLTIGKIYDVVENMKIPFSPSRIDDPTGPFYRVKDDSGKLMYFEKDRFRDLTESEKRELKLNELGV